MHLEILFSVGRGNEGTSCPLDPPVNLSKATPRSINCRPPSDRLWPVSRPHLGSQHDENRGIVVSSVSIRLRQLATRWCATLRADTATALTNDRRGRSQIERPAHGDRCSRPDEFITFRHACGDPWWALRRPTPDGLCRAPRHTQGRATRRRRFRAGALLCSPAPSVTGSRPDRDVRDIIYRCLPPHGACVCVCVFVSVSVARPSSAHTNDNRPIRGTLRAVGWRLPLTSDSNKPSWKRLCHPNASNNN